MDDKKVFVGGLALTTSEEQLLGYFSKYGDIQNASLITNKKTGESKGYAFITFNNEEGAQSSLSANKQELDGKIIMVNAAKKKKGGDRL